MLNIVNLIDDLSATNFGIFNAAVATASSLNNRHGILSYVIVANGQSPVPVEATQGIEELRFATDITDVRNLIRGWATDASTIIASHGCWQRPTRIAAKLSMEGLPWIYHPHGMLEPWSLSQRRWKKKIYFELVERRLVSRAKLVRAVSGPERMRLRTLLPSNQVGLLPNCVAPLRGNNDIKRGGNEVVQTKCDATTRYLFLGRLHRKKAVSELAKAFAECCRSGLQSSHLTIAGPDDGEMTIVRRIADQSDGCVSVVGPIYGEPKRQLLAESHFFVLPSHSEGLPTSILEAMQHGCVPIISDGCNFPEVFEANLGLCVEPKTDSITQVLRRSGELSDRKFAELSEGCQKFIEDHYETDRIADRQLMLYESVLARNDL